MKRTDGYPKITVVICAINEAESLPYVLSKIPNWVDEILLVDGHSDDNTIEVAKKISPDIKLLYQPGKGKGDALKCGVKHASGDIIVTLDADKATDPEEMPKFIEPLLEGILISQNAFLPQFDQNHIRDRRDFGKAALVVQFHGGIVALGLILGQHRGRILLRDDGEFLLHIVIQEDFSHTCCGINVEQTRLFLHSVS